MGSSQNATFFLRVMEHVIVATRIMQQQNNCHGAPPFFPSALASTTSYLTDCTYHKHCQPAPATRGSREQVG